MSSDDQLPGTDSIDETESEQDFDHKVFVKNLTQRPGVYQMYDGAGKILYVGKAKNLKNRVSSYFRARGLTAKTVALVNRIRRIEVTVTSTETEALLLEHNLIKQNKPPYNILLRDDKSYPYIYLSADKFPRLSLHRGARSGKGRYFGPYPNAGAVRESLNFLQKVFQVRQCEDSYFKNRTRPCLQYQIGRCLGPCAGGKVSDEDYQQAVDDTAVFLEGKTDSLTSELVVRMEAASEALEFEKAAEYRDQIEHLRHVQHVQYIDGESGDIDIIAVAMLAGATCVQQLYVRGGQILGSKSHFPKLSLEEEAPEVLGAFLAQRYLSTEYAFSIPREIILNAPVADEALYAEALAQQYGRKIPLSVNVRGERSKWVRLAATTAEQNLRTQINNKQNMAQRYESLAEALSLPETPTRLECFDISHSSGENTVASCVVFDQNGPLKSDYRRFNIEGITGGDDYAAMGQAISRRYKRLKEGEAKLPDLLVIDGGKGQLSQARSILRELQLDVSLLGVAKGSTRKAGFETLIMQEGESWHEFTLPSDSPGLHLLQHIRDESHRFAITGHRARRGKARTTSPLESVAGVGAKRRKELINYFGGLQGIQRASAEELSKVPGISKKIADDIYKAFHSE